MKNATWITILLITTTLLAKANDPDTVVIELSNKSKIVIYTEDKEELSRLEDYDLNKMIKDLNGALKSNRVQKIELQDKTGRKYSKDTTIVIGRERGEKKSIRIGNMELLVDADDWEDVGDELEDAFEDPDRFRRYDYEDKHIDRTDNEFNIEIGLNNWIEDGQFPDADDQPYTLKPFGSWMIGFSSNYKTWLGGALFVNWGFGINWNNFNLQDSDFRIEKGAERIEFTEAPEEFNTRKSRLNVPYGNIHFVPMLDFGKGRRRVRNYENRGVTFRTYKRRGIRIGLGGYAGYRLGGQSKFVYTENGDKEKDKDSGSFYLNNVRYGIRGRFGFKDLDLFVNYDLNEVFSDNRGPAGSPGLNAISFGIIL